MYRHLNLPPFLEVRKVSGAANRTVGLFAKKPIQRGTKLFSRTIHTGGIGGKTLKDMRSVCHHCTANLAADKTYPLVCRNCRIISYCSIDCMEAARPIHRIECDGIIKLEKLRGEVKIEVPRPSPWPMDFGEYWPPAHALLTARVINKGIIKEDQDASDWVDLASCPDELPPSKEKLFAQMEEYIRLLIPDDVSDDELRHTLRTISLNAGKLEHGPSGTMIVAVYNIEYALLSHMCKPNCEPEVESEDSTSEYVVYTIEDIDAGRRLGISYVLSMHYMNTREIRRPHLKQCFGLDCKCYVCEGETLPGSELWLIDKQKSLLIAPWSFKMARQAMTCGWNMFCESTTKSSTDDATVLLESSLRILHIFLDQRNVMVLLTAVTLILKYCKVGACEQAVRVFYKSMDQIGLTMLLKYGTRNDVAEITGCLCTCFLEMRSILEFNVMFKTTQEVHPKRPSCAELCDILQLNPSPRLSAEEVDVPLEDEVKDFAARADRLGIPRDFFEQHIRQLRARIPSGRPYFSTLLEEIQDMLGIRGENSMGMDIYS